MSRSTRALQEALKAPPTKWDAAKEFFSTLGLVYYEKGKWILSLPRKVRDGFVHLIQKIPSRVPAPPLMPRRFRRRSNHNEVVTTLWGAGIYTSNPAEWEEIAMTDSARNLTLAPIGGSGMSRRPDTNTDINEALRADIAALPPPRPSGVMSRHYRNVNTGQIANTVDFTTYDNSTEWVQIRVPTNFSSAIQPAQTSPPNQAHNTPRTATQALEDTSRGIGRLGASAEQVGISMRAMIEGALEQGPVMVAATQSLLQICGLNPLEDSGDRIMGVGVAYINAAKLIRANRMDLLHYLPIPPQILQNEFTMESIVLMVNRVMERYLHWYNNQGTTNGPITLEDVWEMNAHTLMEVFRVWVEYRNAALNNRNVTFASDGSAAFTYQTATGYSGFYTTSRAPVFGVDWARDEDAIVQEVGSTRPDPFRRRIRSLEAES